MITYLFVFHPEKKAFESIKMNWGVVRWCIKSRCFNPSKIPTRQRQYFEQRKRQQQYQPQTERLESYDDGMDISGQHSKEHRSLDIVSLLNLSANAQEWKSACPASMFVVFTISLLQSLQLHFFHYFYKTKYLVSNISFIFNAPGRKNLDIKASTREYEIRNGSPVIISETVVPANFVQNKEASMLSINPYI